jgi:hypothetical protein
MAAKQKNHSQQSAAPASDRDRPQMVSTKAKKPKKTSRGK